MLPESYDDYVNLCLSKGSKPSSKIAKFAARYKFAGQLHNIEILDYSKQKSSAYLLSLRASLAYSAFEQLQEAVGVKNVAILNSIVAEQYKSDDLANFRKFLMSESQSNLANELQKLFENNNEKNLNPVIRALRHTMFHGSFNPTRAGVTSKAAVAFLEALDRQMFKSMNQVFTKHVNNLKGTT
jgi:hypothetical protein